MPFGVNASNKHLVKTEYGFEARVSGNTGR